MNFKELQDLIKLVSKSNLTEFKYKKGDEEISIRTKKYQKSKQIVNTTGATPIVHVPQPATPAPAADKPAFIKVGDRVEEGQVVCIVEAMKLFNEIESEVSGEIVKVIAEDASPVEYDQVLFLVDPSK